MSENKQIILSVLYIDHFAWFLGASPGEVVDQIQEVECHQEEGKHKEQSEDHAGRSDHYIHRDSGTLVRGLKSKCIMIVALKVLKLIPELVMGQIKFETGFR